MKLQSHENLISDVADSALGIVKSKSRQSPYSQHLTTTTDIESSHRILHLASFTHLLFQPAPEILSERSDLGPRLAASPPRHSPILDRALQLPGLL